MKRLQAVLLLLFVLFLFPSCKQKEGSEPEQIYLVSAVGIDPMSNGNLQISLEVPLVRENEAEKIQKTVFTGEGESFSEALDDARRGLAKKMQFSHCALLVLNENFDVERCRSFISFFSDGATLPLAAQVVLAPNASDLLKKESVSTPAAGYDIPGILQQQNETFRCRIYETLASDPLELPMIRPAEETKETFFAFAGISER